MSVPLDIAIAYLIQGSFYGHSIYATVYMDAWRKDSAVMVVHHIITLALISFSYAFRYIFKTTTDLLWSVLVLDRHKTVHHINKKVQSKHLLGCSFFWLKSIIFNSEKKQ